VQIRDVARVLSRRGRKPFRVHCCSSFGRSYDQVNRLRSGTDVLIGTPGRLKYLMFEEPSGALDLSGCRAVVFDEVDVLVQEDARLTVDDIQQKTPRSLQYVFVTATLGGNTREQLKAFAALPSVSQPPTPNNQTPKKGLVWRTGPGLHRISPKCEHVLVDCTPPDLYKIDSDRRHPRVMSQKALALGWHLKYGILRELEETRVVVFCNTIDNCRLIENELRKLDSRGKRSGSRAWKVLVLHGQRSKEDYQNIVDDFNGDRVKARDFFKKKILVCTDRLSRGVDFSQQPVNWVVLLDWPRDATEYIRRVGRTARGGASGGVLSFLSGYTELKMAKQVTSAAVRGIALQNSRGGVSEGFHENAFCLERFDPTVSDWRSREASAQNPRGSQGMEEEDLVYDGLSAGRSEQGEQFDENLWDDDEAVEEEWAPWKADNWNGAKGVPWEEGEYSMANDQYDDDEMLGPMGEDVGVSLP